MEDSAEDSGRQAEEHDGSNSRRVPEPVCGPGDPAVSVPSGKKLVLHVDLNNTVLVSDAVTGQGTEAALDSFLTTVTWGTMDKHGKLQSENTPDSI